MTRLRCRLVRWFSLIRHPFRWLAHKLVAAAWRYLP